MIITAALALCATAALLGGHGAEDPAPQHSPPAATQTTDKPTTIPAPVQQETEVPADNASELWSDDGTLRRIKPLDVDLDAETQWAIYEACEYDPGLFCLVMAIAEHESGFDPQTVACLMLSAVAFMVTTNVLQWPAYITSSAAGAPTYR